MGTSKNQKAKPINSNDPIRKAGPKKPGFKPRKTGVASNREQPLLFDAISQDRIIYAAQRRVATTEQLNKSKVIEMRRNFSTHQADRAMMIIEASNNAVRVVAEQIIINFRTAQSDRSRNISRTAAAVLMLDSQLDAKMLKNKNAMSSGKAAAHKALTTAYLELEAEIAQLSESLKPAMA